MQRVSLKRLKEILDKTEALTGYEEVKENNTELRKKVQDCCLQLGKMQKENSKYKALKTRFAGKEINLEEFNKKMLKQTRKIYGEEIKRKAQKKFDAESLTLTKNELNRLLKLPNKKKPPILRKLLDKEVNVKVNRILKKESLQPQWFTQSIEKKIKDQVNKRLDNIYWANIREGIRKAKEEEWPSYLEKYTREKITSYCKTVLLERFIQDLINQKINLTCKNCKTIYLIQLTKGHISNLLKDGFTVFACSTPNCVEGIFNRHPTHIRFYLGEAISMLVGKPRMPQDSFHRYKADQCSEN